MIDITEARKKVDTYKLLAQEFMRAVKDEQEAINFYTRIIDEAARGGCGDDAGDVRMIRDQEQQHKRIFERHISEVNQKGIDLSRRIEDEQRKLMDERRKKAEADRQRSRR